LDEEAFGVALRRHPGWSVSGMPGSINADAAKQAASAQLFLNAKPVMDPGTSPG
jgi:hypothetical protein